MDGNPDVYVMNADGTAQTNLTNNPAQDYGIDWQPLVVATATPTATGTATPTATPTPTPTDTPPPAPPLGGSGVYPDVGGMSGGGNGAMNFALAAGAALAVSALAGVGWYARRR